MRIPVYIAISYIFYFGLAYVLLVPAFRDRIHPPRKIWSILLSIGVSAWLFEVPFNVIGLWHHYGDQPYQIFPEYGLQPLW